MADFLKKISAQPVIGLSGKEGKDYRTLERKSLVRSSLGLLNTS